MSGALSVIEEYDEVHVFVTTGLLLLSVLSAQRQFAEVRAKLVGSRVDTNSDEGGFEGISARSLSRFADIVALYKNIGKVPHKLLRT